MENKSFEVQQQLEKIHSLMKRRDFIEALKLCDAIIDEDESNYQAYCKRSFIYYELGEREEAFGDLAQLIEFRPDSPSTYFRRARWNLEYGNDLKAIHDLTIVVETQDPYYLDVAYFFRATAHLNLSENELALADCEKIPDDFAYMVKSYKQGRRSLSKSDLLERASR